MPEEFKNPSLEDIRELLSHCDLEKLGKELGVLAAYERFDEEAP